MQTSNRDLGIQFCAVKHICVDWGSHHFSVMKLQNMKRNRVPSKLQTADSGGKIRGQYKKTNIREKRKMETPIGTH